MARVKEVELRADIIPETPLLGFPNEKVLPREQICHYVCEPEKKLQIHVFTRVPIVALDHLAILIFDLREHPTNYFKSLRVDGWLTASALIRNYLAGNHDIGEDG